MFPCQNYNELPAKVDCIVHEDHGSVRITQDYSVIIRDQYQVGGIYPFKLKNLDNGKYEGEDSNGLRFRIVRHPNRIMYSGQSIKAKILSINGVKVEMEMIEDTKDPRVIPFVKTLPIAPFDSEETLEQVLDTLPDVREQYAGEDGRWVVSLALKAADSDSVTAMLDYSQALNALCIYLIEESDLLKKVAGGERKKMIDKLTVAARHAADYAEASRLRTEGKANEYIDRCLTNLRDSENLYQPESKLRIMMCLLSGDNALMTEMMDRIFEIIVRGNKANWQVEPFRSAFVEMLSLYINEHRDKATRAAGVATIHRLIKAIGIQMLLAQPSDGIDCALNRATYLRLLAYIQRYASTDILDDAFFSLFTPFTSKTLEYGWEDVDNLDNLYMRAAYPEVRPSRRMLQPRFFRTDRMELIIDDSGVTLQPRSGRPQNMDVSNLIQWQNFRICLNDPIKNKIKPGDRLTKVAKFWKDINKGLLEVSNTPRQRSKVAPGMGDTVMVRVKGFSDDQQWLDCEIDDELYYGAGWLKIKDILPYMEYDPQMLGFFRDRDGQEMLYEVTVVRESEDPYDLEFSMRKQVDYYLRETDDHDEPFLCNIRDKNKYASHSCIGIAENGAPCIVFYDEGVVLGKNDIVEVISTDMNENGQKICRYRRHSGPVFRIADGIRRLMQEMGYLPESEQQENISEEPLSIEEMNEIIGILDRLAVISQTRAGSYSLLKLAEILSTLIGDTFKQSYYQKRMDVISAFEDYENNGFVNSERFAQLRRDLDDESIANDYLLNEAMAKFKILDALRRRSDLRSLQEIVSTSTNPSIRAAADLAIALTITSPFEMPMVEREITSRINAELGVNIKVSDLKDFGVETQDLEFKSSIIYPAGYNMQPSPATQEMVIMRTICGFLNSDRGGTLMLGVNKSGTACGIENDLVYLNTDLDGYSRHIHGWIRREWGLIVNDCCKYYEKEEDGGYTVYKLLIKPSPSLVRYRGRAWVRQDTETLPLPEADVAEYTKRHAAAVQASSPTVDQTPGENVIEDTGTDIFTQKGESKGGASTPQVQLQTSRWRSNPVNRYDEDFGIDVEGYLHFRPKCKYEVTADIDYHPSELTVAIRTDEADGHVVVAYDNGCVLVSPTVDILARLGRDASPRYDESTPIFVSPMRPGDQVLTVWRSTRNELSARIDSVEDYIKIHANGNLNSPGYRIASPNATLVAAEIVPKEKVLTFSAFAGKGGSLGTKLTPELLQLLATELYLDPTA